MIKPSYDEVLNLKDNYSVIPIYKEIYADAFTPVSYTHLTLPTKLEV